ncbi:MAG: helix-turn-helix domain-containing protein [Verrucomicrobiales bacterium]|nr:helix-turn-helix domain-containing protein [Verrucomicrobiales bacterium]
MIELQTEKRPTRLAFSIQETAAMLGLSDKSVRRLIWRGLLHPSRALRHIRIPKDEIERFLRETR